MASPQLDSQAVLDYSACVLRDAAAAREQHAQLVQQLSDLATQVVEPLGTAVEAMPAVCERLEATFQKIDALNAYLDRINGDILALHTACRSILDAPTLSEKASGWLGKLTNKSKTESGVWKRVPETLVVGGNVAADFLEQFHDSVAGAATVASSMKKQ